MDLNLKGKKALVTGSGRGIGQAIADALRAEGAIVMTNSRSLSKDEMHVQGDVTSTEGLAKIGHAIRTQFKSPLDILVCNVGSGRSAAPGAETSQDWKSSLEQNLYSATNVIESLRGQMSPGGSILCISSICGLEALGAPLTYSAAKAALNSYVVGASRIFAKDGLRINAIAPGNIFFPDSVWEKKWSENPQQVQAMLDQQVALKKLGRPEDVANMALFLVSEKAGFITGSVMVVDGGQVRSW